MLDEWYEMEQYHDDAFALANFRSHSPYGFIRENEGPMSTVHLDTNTTIAGDAVLDLDKAQVFTDGI